MSFIRFFLFFLISIDCFARSNDRVYQQSPPPWMMEQIQEDLVPFRESGIRSEEIEEYVLEQERLGNPLGLVLYKIVNNKVFEKNLRGRADLIRTKLITEALQILSRQCRLPDIDFIVGMGDGLDGFQHSVPIFAFAKNPSLAPKIILIPDYDAVSGNLSSMTQVQVGNQKYQWPRKINKAVWRGAMTGGMFTTQNFLLFPRSQAVTYSLQFPYLINARYSSINQTDEPEAIKTLFADYFGEWITVENHIEYKYQLAIDGNTCAFSRFYWQLFSNCLILKPESSNIQWYYRALQPYVHYIPLENDLSDVKEKIEWAMENDAEMQKISRQAQSFAKKNLIRERIFQYLYLLLVEYGKLQIS